MDSHREPEPIRGGVALIGVYREQDLDAVLHGLDELGVTQRNVHVDDPDDTDRSLVSEMREEANEGFVMPLAGVAYPKEATKSMVAIGVPVVVVCTLLALPFGFLAIGDLALWARLLLMGLVGATLGLVVALVVGPALGAKRPDEPLAADRGTTVRVDAPTDAVASLMRTSNPVRLDRVYGERAAAFSEVVATEDRSAGRGIVDEVRRNTRNPRRENDPGPIDG